MECLVSCAEDFDFVLSVSMSPEDFEQRTATLWLVLKGSLWPAGGELTGVKRERQGDQLEAFVVKARTWGLDKSDGGFMGPRPLGSRCQNRVRHGRALLG